MSTELNGPRPWPLHSAQTLTAANMSAWGGGSSPFLIWTSGAQVSASRQFSGLKVLKLVLELVLELVLSRSPRSQNEEMRAATPPANVGRCQGPPLQPGPEHLPARPAGRSPAEPDVPRGPSGRELRGDRAVLSVVT